MSPLWHESQGYANGLRGVVVGRRGSDIPAEDLTLYGQQPVSHTCREHADGGSRQHVVDIVVVASDAQHADTRRHGICPDAPRPAVLRPYQFSTGKGTGSVPRWKRLVVAIVWPALAHRQFQSASHGRQCRVGRRRHRYPLTQRMARLHTAVAEDHGRCQRHVLQAVVNDLGPCLPTRQQHRRQKNNCFHGVKVTKKNQKTVPCDHESEFFLYFCG